MIISLAPGYEKAVEIVSGIMNDRIRAINLVTDSTTYPMVPATSDAIAITYFPCACPKVYGAGMYAIATLWDLDISTEDPIGAAIAIEGL